MSGGHFDYACFHAEDSEVFQYLSQFKAMEQWCRAYQKHDAADEVLSFILTLETAMRRVHTHGKHVSKLLEAIEWAASGDGDHVDYAHRKLFEGEKTE